MHERNVSGLKESAQQRKKLTLEQTNNAISQMVKSGKKINFHSVAEAAGVSVAYLYKYEELKQRIDQLRKQQSSIKSSPRTQGASDDSKKALYSTLKLRVRELESEVKGLRNHIEVIQGVSLQVADLNQEIDLLTAENLRLTNELHELRITNSKLLEEQPATSSKVTSLADKRKSQTTVSNKVITELAKLGINLNPTLTKTIKSAPEQLVLSAIEALKEAMASGDINRPGGWLNKAIREGWMPNEKHLQKTDFNFFKERFGLAYKQKLVLASRKGDDDQLYVYTREGVALPFEEMLALHPLDTLRGASEKHTL